MKAFPAPHIISCVKCYTLLAMVQFPSIHINHNICSILSLKVSQHYIPWIPRSSMSLWVPRSSLSLWVLRRLFVPHKYQELSILEFDSTRNRNHQHIEHKQMMIFLPNQQGTLMAKHQFTVYQEPNPWNHTRTFCRTRLSYLFYLFCCKCSFCILHDCQRIFEMRYVRPANCGSTPSTSL
jgi:hypothetical protein